MRQQHAARGGRWQHPSLSLALVPCCCSHIVHTETRKYKEIYQGQLPVLYETTVPTHKLGQAHTLYNGASCVSQTHSNGTPGRQKHNDLLTAQSSTSRGRPRRGRAHRAEPRNLRGSTHPRHPLPRPQPPSTALSARSVEVFFRIGISRRARSGDFRPDRAALRPPAPGPTDPAASAPLYRPLPRARAQPARPDPYRYFFV